MSEPIVKREQHEGQWYWRKQHAPTQRPALRALMRFFADAIGVPALRSPVAQTAAQAQTTELRMIQRGLDAGVRVPAIRHDEGGGILLADLGGTLAAAFRNAAPERRWELLREAFEALLEAHRRRFACNQAFARNLTWDGKRIGFIDFEEDPTTVMSLQDAQVRDWLCLLYSTARYFQGRTTDFLAMADAHLQDEDATVRAAVGDAHQRLRKFTIFKPLVAKDTRAWFDMLRAIPASTR